MTLTTIYFIGFILAFAWGLCDVRRLYNGISLSIAISCAAIFAALWFVTAPLMAVSIVMNKMRFNLSA